MSKYQLIVLVLLTLTISGTLYTVKKDVNVGGGAGISAPKCSVSSTEVATLGNQLSSTVLAANETRAWARIQQPLNATNTVALSFDEGAAAVRGEGYTLTNATTTSPVAMTDAFGRATDLPYTGAVTAISSTGSSTVLVTECSY